MSTRANSAFVIENREVTPAQWEGGALHRNRWTKKYTGDLTATGTLEAIMVGVEGGNPAAYLGVERIAGTLHGRKGTFIAVLSATAYSGDHAKSWKILPGSGTEELVGIRGEGEILDNHDFVLDYDIES